MKNFNKTLFYIIQWTWGFSVNIVGLIGYLYCKLRGYKCEKFGYSYYAYVPWKQGGLSLGIFIFIRENHPQQNWTYNTKIHEYGHSWQCLILGPLYWIVIAVPSLIWCNVFANYRQKNNISYYVFYPEKWANYNGQKASGLKMKLPEQNKECSE